MYRIVKMLRNGLTATGVTGQETVATYIAFFTVNMELHADILHGASSS
jgi:hypothetical protein